MAKGLGKMSLPDLNGQNDDSDELRLENRKKVPTDTILDTLEYFYIILARIYTRDKFIPIRLWSERCKTLRSEK